MHTDSACQWDQFVVGFGFFTGFVDTKNDNRISPELFVRLKKKCWSSESRMSGWVFGEEEEQEEEEGWVGGWGGLLTFNVLM